MTEPPLGPVRYVKRGMAMVSRLGLPRHPGEAFIGSSGIDDETTYSRGKFRHLPCYVFTHCILLGI